MSASAPGFAPEIRPVTRRAKLRSATLALHAQLDAKFLPETLSDRSRYSQFLCASALALVPIERSLERSGIARQFADWSQRQRTPYLFADLAALGMICPVVPESRDLDLSAAFGAMYVLEGSRLGAQVLLRRVAVSGDFAMRSATHYLRANDPNLWRTFLAQLESSTLICDEEQLIVGACDAFNLFLRAFDE